MNIHDEINKLSTAEKMLLMEEIWGSIEDNDQLPLSAEKKEFLDQRIDAINNGKASFVTLEEIKQRFNSLK